MSNLVIVAIPEAGDPVWRISSEKVPHMTLLFLGDNGDHPDLAKIVAFVEHAASLTLNRFGLEVSKRGTLGEDEADVVFFEDSWELPTIKAFRSQLLKYDPIRTAYDSVMQFPEWHPHLTLGYPESPAKPMPDPFSDKIYYVQFDRIAVWNGDYDGVEIELKRYQYAEVAMSETADAGAEFLAHFGVKGMRWGQRKSPEEREAALRANRPAQETKAHDTIGTSKRSPTKIATKGGEDHPATPDAINVAKSRQKLQKSGVHALSNKELREVAERLNLENQVAKLSPRRQTLGQKFVKNILGDPEGSFKTAQSVYNVTKPFIPAPLPNIPKKK